MTTNNAINTPVITLGGPFTISGAFATTFTITNITAVTFPTSGTLATTSQIPATPITATNGGTGVSNPAIHTLPVAEGAANFNFLGPLTNGQLLIGSTGLDPVVAGLSAGAGITISTGAGTITIASTGGGLTWSEIVASPHVIAVNNGYVANLGGGIAFSLPATSVIGDMFSIVGKAGVWSITQGAGQQIHVGTTSTTLGALGTLTAANAKDSVTFVCITANLEWQVVGGPQTAGFVLA